jgi:hypothetical protein
VCLSSAAFTWRCVVAPEAAKETVERTHGIYAMRCPLYRTLHKTIQLTSSFELVAPATRALKFGRQKNRNVLIQLKTKPVLPETF